MSDPISSDPISARHAEGMATRRSVLGDAHVDRAEAATSGSARDTLQRRLAGNALPCRCIKAFVL